VDDFITDRLRLCGRSELDDIKRMGIGEGGGGMEEHCGIRQF